jgi:hypothetical protein
MNSFAMSVLAALALRADNGRRGDQGRPARSAGRTGGRSTRNYSGQRVVQGVTHRGLLLRVERAHGDRHGKRSTTLIDLKFMRYGASPPDTRHNAVSHARRPTGRPRTPPRASPPTSPSCRSCLSRPKGGSAYVYSITLSARATSVAGTVTPIALAVLRLIASSNFVACSTGISATLLPPKRWTICWAITS